MKIAIIGAAGVLGSCAAFTITMNRLADEVLMVGHTEDKLKGHWLDLETVGASLDVKVTKGTYDDLAGTDIVVMAAGAPTGAIKSRSELLPGSLPIIRAAAEKINHHCPQAIVLMETNPVDPLNYAMYRLSTDKVRSRYIGYSVNDTIRFRKWVAESLGVSPSRIEGLVIGEHGNSQVMVFSSLRLDGKPVELDRETREKIKGQPVAMLNAFEILVPRRTAGWTSAYGTGIIIEAIKNNTGLEIPCNAVLEGEYGLGQISMTVPVKLGKEGIKEIRELPLTSEEKSELEHSVQALRPLMHIVDNYIASDGQ